MNLDDLSDEFKAMQNKTAAMLANQKKLEQGIGEYAKILVKIKKTQNDILHIEEQKNKQIKELAEYEASIQNKKERWQALAESKSEKIAASAKVALAKLKAEVVIRKKNVALLGLQVKEEKESLDTLKEAVKESNKLKAIARSTGKFFKGIGVGFGKLKTLGVFEMDKEIRNAARSIGVGAKQSAAFSSNLERAADTTVFMGVNVKKLAEMQKSYSEEVGRATILSVEGLQALAQMEEGTGIAGFGVSMAASMDKFGASVLTSRDLVLETVEYARSIGVNAAKAAEMTSKSLKLAQRFRFKGGAEGLAKMATESLKLKIDMDAMAGVADKVFRPEAAIEFAARLQTMGGAFARMADPMQLMFKARNDMEGFSKDIAKASSEFVTFNKKTGEFDVKGGAALDRMRELGEITSLGAERLQEMAVAQKRIEMIGSITPVNFSDEDAELISGMAKIEKGGEIKIQVGELSKYVKNLTQRDLKFLRKEKETLDERAEEARTAAETLDDIKTSFSQLLIPIAKALKKDFAEPLKDLVNNEEFKESIRSFISGAASIVGTITKFIIKNPIKSIGIALLGTTAIWIAKGAALGAGFNLVASAMGPGSLLGGLSGLGTKMGLLGAAGGLSKGAMVGGGVLAGGLAAYSEYSENSEMGMDRSENIGRTAAKGIGAGAGALAGAAIGTALFPVVGTLIGGLIGGAVGAYGGGALGEAAGDAIYGDEKRGSMSMRANTLPVKDGIVKLGTKVSFDDRDNFLLASTSKNQLNKSAETLTNNGSGGSTNNGSTKMTHKFERMDVNININAVGVSDDMAKAIVNSNEIKQGLNVNINRMISANLNGGIESAKG